MTFSKPLFLLFFLLIILLFPLRHASKPKKCPSRWESLRCGPSEVYISFPFCGHKGFNLYCNNLNKTVLQLPMSGTFLVDRINYLKQHITIKDPENCLPKRFLNFNLSGSPFSSPFYVEYTFITCPSKVVLPSSYQSITCLNNSTSSFYATTSYSQADPMFRSCQMVKRTHVPVRLPYEAIEFFDYIGNQSLLLEWHSPNCTRCEMNGLRCGLKNKASLKVKCFGDVSGTNSIIFLCYFSLFTIQVNSIHGMDEEEV